MLIYFCRHGQTDHNAQGIIQGQLDTPLNDAGRGEAALLRDHLKDIPFAEAWSSDLSRAYETAQILTSPHPGLEIQTHPELKERDLGSLSGSRWVKGYKLPDDVESSIDFRARVSSWFAYLLSLHAASPPEGPILVVSHGAYLSALLGVLLSPPYSLNAHGVNLQRRCHNTCVMRIKVNQDAEDKWKGRILAWAEVDHLGGNVKDIGVADDLRNSARVVVRHGRAG